MLALASAIVCRPELLLVDELSLGLAPVVVEDLLRRLAEIRRELAITILIVEQSATVALEMSLDSSCSRLPPLKRDSAVGVRTQIEPSLSGTRARTRSAGPVPW